jgi:hypothetical protein
MTITIVAVLCHLVTVHTGADPLDVCHEEIVHVGDSMQECMMFPASLAQWKDAGRFRDDEWRIAKVRCIPGTYEKRDAI